MTKKDKNIDKKIVLSAKWENFCQEFVVDNDKTKAYLRAYPKCKNRSGACSSAQKLLDKPKIKARIAELQTAKIKRQERTADDLISRLWAIADDKITNYLRYKNIQKNNSLGFVENAIDIEVFDSDKVDTSNIAEVSMTREGSFKFKLTSKEFALRQLKEIYFNTNTESEEEDFSKTFGSQENADFIKKQIEQSK